MVPRSKPGGASQCISSAARTAVVRRVEVQMRIPVQSDRGFRSKVTVDSGPK